MLMMVPCWPQRAQQRAADADDAPVLALKGQQKGHLMLMMLPSWCREAQQKGKLMLMMLPCWHREFQRRLMPMMLPCWPQRATKRAS